MRRLSSVCCGQPLLTPQNWRCVRWQRSVHMTGSRRVVPLIGNSFFYPSEGMGVPSQKPQSQPGS